MSLQQEISRNRAFLGNIGRAGLHSMFGNDFEFYSCSFELVDGYNNVVGILVFPILPDSISINTKTLSNIKKGSSSVVSLYNPSFVPFQINLSGTFGRKFRILLGNEDLIISAFNFKQRISGTSDLKQGNRSANLFNNKIKTGYGVTKLLEQMIESSFLVDDNGSPVKLIFNNQTFNQSHVVEVESYSFSQSEKGNNMYWNYNIVMRAIAPALQIKPVGKSSIYNLAQLSVINNFVNDFISDNKQEYIARSKKIIADKLNEETIISLGFDIESDKSFNSSISGVNGGFGIGGGL